MPTPISIVPTQPQAKNVAGVVGHFTYRGGPLLSRVEVINVFWGKLWQQSGYSFLANNLNVFMTRIIQSPLLDQLAEYNVPAYTINQGTFGGNFTITTLPLPPMIFGHSFVRDGAIQSMLQQAINQGLLPTATPNRLYIVYLPAGFTVIKDFSMSCLQFCGYHNHVNGQIFYAVMPYPNCQECNTGFLPFDALTITASHELCEAITDAIPGQGWYDDTFGEIGDICAWKTKQIGPYTVQREWSQQNNACA